MHDIVRFTLRIIARIFKILGFNNYNKLIWKKIEKNDLNILRDELIEKTHKDKFVKEINFIKENGITWCPYDWIKDYEDKKQHIEVIFDDKSNLRFVFHNSKRLYFPSQFSDDQIKSLYVEVQKTDDKRSPHRYFSKEYNIESDDIFLDIGAAEGFLSLDCIEKVKKVYIFEGDQIWIPALEATFAPYVNKVKIINKFVSNVSDENNIRIDDLLNLKDRDFCIKIDVEGSERSVLEGMNKMLANNKCKIFLATYHYEEDAEFFKNFFSNKFSLEFSDGYMIFPAWGNDPRGEKPSFRKGVLRCK